MINPRDGTRVEDIAAAQANLAVAKAQGGAAKTSSSTLQETVISLPDS
ncbi:hypothetical protein [uncultured Bartonella sp.]|nr:hypothetical protein [uncultured Bartonella sp.]